MRPRPGRRSVRLVGADYGAPGLYFITVCTAHRQPLFGHVVEGRMVLSDVGRIARDEWLRTPTVRPTVALDAFVVMPDHVHLLFGILGGPDAGGPGAGGPDAGGPDVGAYRDTPLRVGTAVRPAGRRPGPVSFRSPSWTVGAILRGYKGAATTRIRRLDATLDVWQRGFHDRIVRSDREADAARRYIRDNPARWAAQNGKR